MQGLYSSIHTAQIGDRRAMLLRLALIAGCAALQHKFGRESYGARVTRGAADLPPLLLIPPVGVGIDRQFYARFQDVWDGGYTHAPD